MLAYNNYGAEDSFINLLRTNSYPEVIEILKQYLILSDYIFANNSDAIINLGSISSKNKIWASSLKKIDVLLEPLVKFSDSWGKYLPQEDKDMILNFILPRYEDVDKAVKIYSLLTKTE